MQEQKFGSVLIVNDREECIGIFTVIDALEILADILDDDDNSSTALHLGDYVEYWALPANLML